MKKVDLLRRVLSLPWLWIIAHNYILENYEHEQGTQCLVCDALARDKEQRHEALLTMTRQLVCKKCGINARHWSERPRCKGVSPERDVAPPRQYPVTVLPSSW